MDELLAWLRLHLDGEARMARAAAGLCGCCPPAPRWLFADDEHQGRIVTVDDPHPVIRRQLGRRWNRAYGDLFAARHIARWDPARALAEVAFKRRLLDEHAAEWRSVEWPHDQDGKGRAQVCRRCQNAEHSEWSPPVGQAGVLPEGFVTPYVLAPCNTVRLLALPYAGEPGYREAWRPSR